MSDILKHAEAVVGSAKIISIKQTKGEFRATLTGEIDDLNQSLTVTHSVDGKKVEATVCLKLIGTAKDTPEQHDLFIEGHFVFAYEILDDFKDDQVAAFARVGGAYNCWPFWREYVHSTCTRLQIPPLTAPLMTPKEFASLVEKVDNKELDE